VTTFDDVLFWTANVLRHHAEAVARLGPILVNRDLYGRIRLVVDQRWEGNEGARADLASIARGLEEDLGPHAHPAEEAVLFEDDVRALIEGEAAYQVDAELPAWVVDRLTTDADWSSIAPPTAGPARIVFYSIKGGVGRSTALAVAAWHVAEGGERVLVVDLDLESPGLSTALLPEDRRPRFGVTDWLVEDLVGNADVVRRDMVATSELSRDGAIFVVPAHGAHPGAYVAKLGRAWMPVMTQAGARQPWFARLQRLLGELEAELRPTVVLIDARAGIDEVASACLTDLGATAVLAFALDSEPTWTGYRILLQHWRETHAIRRIRERLQIVGALAPEQDTATYTADLRERSWDLFTSMVYDEVPAAGIAALPPLADGEPWSFDLTDETAPHHPWVVRWNSGFAALRSLHGRLVEIDAAQARAVFGPLLDGIESIVQGARPSP
jgi:hypothetical protein